MSPEEFAAAMTELAKGRDPEVDHIKADELLCELLASLGYGDGVKIFKDVRKWYA